MLAAICTGLKRLFPSGQKNFENGHITYCEAHHNMAIFYAQTDNPNLSVDVIPIGRVTSDLSVFDELDSRQMPASSHLARCSRK